MIKLHLFSYYFVVSYTDAQVKAVKAQETSELSSNDDEHQKTKRTKSKESVENLLKITHAPTFDDYESNGNIY